ncbi:hypothetical protein FOQG_06741 [Fusarium oxysporum f. sp. raphani 54005]|uniref:Uncharacterized protein n=4 Tax=Fusarium oxysporum TaxID=5507 RepID=X0CA95_FUSOX|nr:hypothetical protein FOVG_06450 [Fusarium oxysporum f. sp. pisi HDV247]EXK91345.1 hypothetical protein FOQG_06741 [Fusarium oxysporum f. sp. raphani 54005]EXL84482.1 hypothetical protein FOPG_03071 [Fusarium oxysporum f. sp. conglutinans race 2 54008]EXM32276.1 hypothetical protein FOTG_02712 [Fusarium oxysporum f. sp. vasinfectum 25433]KAJ4219805.1 hypothetical protein NW760_012426 [Fusarium oxysporum]
MAVGGEVAPAPDGPICCLSGPITPNFTLVDEKVKEENQANSYMVESFYTLTVATNILFALGDER